MDHEGVQRRDDEQRGGPTGVSGTARREQKKFGRGCIDFPDRCTISVKTLAAEYQQCMSMVRERASSALSKD